MRSRAVPILASLVLAAGSVHAQPVLRQTSVNAFDSAAMLSGDCRMVVLGDSFAFTTYQRVFCGMLNVWDRSPLTAAYIPAGTRTKLGQGTPAASPFTEIAAETTSGYEALAFTATPEYVTLPVRSVLEFEGGLGLTLGPDDSLVEYSVRNSTLKNTPGGRMFAVGDTVRMRGLFWAPPDISVLHGGLGFSVGGVVLDQFDLAAQARELLHLGETPTGLGRAAVAGRFNALARDVDFTVQQGNSEGVVSLVSLAGAVATGEAVHAAGAVYTVLDSQTQQREPGLYYSALADSSWSYNGFGTDSAPGFSLDKVFEQAQLTHWLDVTTLDSAQPVVFIYYFAAEPNNTGDAPAKIEAMIDQSAASAAAVGLSSVRHLLVMPHFHRIPGIADDTTLRQRFEQQRDAMFEIAGRRAEVSAVSIYDATGGVLLDGSTEARDWLRANVPAPFEYAGNSVDLADGLLGGDLLDSITVHPANEDAAAFYAKKFVDALLAPLQLDFNNDGFLDNGDISSFVSAFLASDPAADMNGDSFLDNGDISSFVQRFLAEI